MGGGAGYQPGSTFKPVIAAAALDQGMSPYQSYPSPYRMQYPAPVQTCDGKSGRAGRPTENENSSEVGPYGMKEATAKSVNTYFVQLISDIGHLPRHSKWRRRWASRAPTARRSHQVPSHHARHPGDVAADHGRRLRHLRQPRRVLHPRRHRVDHRRAGQEAARPEEQLRARRCRRRPPIRSTPCSRAWSRTAPARRPGSRAATAPARPVPRDEPLRRLVRGLHAEHGRRGLGRRPGAQAEDVRHHHRRRYHDKVFGGDAPGPIWRDAMSGALSGKPAPSLPTVPIDDPGKDKKADDDGKGHGKPKPGKRGHGGNKPGGGWRPPGTSRTFWAAVTAAGDRLLAAGARSARTTLSSRGAAAARSARRGAPLMSHEGRPCHAWAPASGPAPYVRAQASDRRAASSPPRRPGRPRPGPPPSGSRSS